MKTLDDWAVTMDKGLLRARHRKYGDFAVNLGLAGGTFETATRLPHRMSLPDVLREFASTLESAQAIGDRR